MDLDYSQIAAGAGTVLATVAAGAGTVLATVWAAYSDFSNQPAWKKALMIFGPIALLGLFLALVG